jgi:hypothetical protein
MKLNLIHKLDIRSSPEGFGLLVEEFSMAILWLKQNSDLIRNKILGKK